MPIKTLTLTLPKPHNTQRRCIQEAARFNVLDCGRRWGKNILAIDRAIETMLAGFPVGWFEPSYKTLSDVWREVKNVLAPITKAKNEQEHRIELITNGVLEMWSLDNPDVARGRRYKRVIINEAGLVKNLGDIWNMVIRPMLADYSGDGWILSTPKGRNFFWQMYQWGIDPGNQEWRAWNFPTADNPRIPPGEIEAMQRTMPDRIFRQEILAEFLDDAGGIFRGVMEAATADIQEIRDEQHDYIMGVDWGKHNDYTVLAVLDTTDRALAYLDRFNQIDYQFQLARLQTLFDRFKPSTIVAERNSMGEPLIEQLQRMNFPIQPFMTTNTSKTQAIEALSLAFERKEIRIIPDPVLIGELQAYEAERLPSGLLRYGAPEGMHDDTVMALAMAWHGADNSLWYFT